MDRSTFVSSRGTGSSHIRAPGPPERESSRPVLSSRTRVRQGRAVLPLLQLSLHGKAGRFAAQPRPLHLRFGEPRQMQAGVRLLPK